MVIGKAANIPVSVPTPGVSVGAVGEAWGVRPSSQPVGLAIEHVIESLTYPVPPFALAATSCR